MRRDLAFRFVLMFLSFLMSAGASALLAAGAAQAAQGDCGQPLSTGDNPTIVDAQHVLRTSVGATSCSLCTCDVNNNGTITTTDALLVLQTSVGLSVTLDCPLECVDTSFECPRVAQFALFANVRAGLCTSNADCAAFSFCDTVIGRCRTHTQSDVGWTGLAHNADIDDPIPARVFVDCEGPAPCGQCEIVGHDPSLGNCRCENDNRTRCFTVAGPDEANCGGEQCVCNFGPPMPLSAGNLPVCVINTLGGQPDGEANVDTGSGTINLHLKEKIFIGASLFAPCPICLNDTTPADGMRNGVCVGGQNDTQSCDAQAYNATFPPPTGALYSLDCFPEAEADISSGGLPLEIPLSTGQLSLEATVPCAGTPEQLCPCLVCSEDETLACNTNADCEEAGAGSCTSDGSGASSQPNACEGFVCEDAGNNEGFCATGPDDFFCDAILRPTGRGLIGCAENIDCAASSIGVEAGNCTLVERRPCFLDPIVSQGFAHPVVPFAAAPYCAPPVSSGSVNNATGLPGPGRLQLQTAVTLFCKSNPTSVYTPGVGNCPAPP